MGSDSSTMDSIEKGGVPESAPTVRPKASKPTGSRKKIVVSGLCFAALACGVGLAIGLPYSKSTASPSSSQSATNQPEGTGSDKLARKIHVTGYLNSTLSLWGESVTKGYMNEDELQDDLANAARFLVNNVVSRNMRVPGFDSNPEITLGGSPDILGTPEMESTGVSDTGATDAASSPVGKDVNDFGTNNQESGVEEGDAIVSDGDYVYAAYGDVLVAWNAKTGANITSLKMDAPQKMSTQRLSIPVASNNAVVRELLLEGSRLVAVVSGYGPEVAAARDLATPPILQSLYNTRVIVYDTTSLSTTGSLTMLFQEDINGEYNSIRGIGENIHVTTISNMDTYTHLVNPFERWSLGEVSDEVYLGHVSKMADEKIPAFIEQLSSELVFNGALPNFARISLMQEEASGTILEQVVYNNGVANTVAQVFSFKVSHQVTATAPKPNFSVSGAFLSEYSGRVYAAKDMLMICSNGYNYNLTSGESMPYTYLFGMSLNEDSSAPHSTGLVRGNFLNTHSVDVKDDIVFVATTIQNRWFVMMDDMAEATVTRESESMTENYINALRLTGSDGDSTPGTMELLSSLQLGKINEIFTAVRFFDNVAYAVTFERTDPFYVLDLENPEAPVILAELEINGFSSYLHSMNDDNSLLLAIGEDATEDGEILGLMITVFDVRDKSNPAVAQRYTIEKDENTWSGSTAAWDFKAVRFERTTQRLIIPVNINSWQDPTKNFHGFIVFVANEDMITESCRINHEQYDIPVNPVPLPEITERADPDVSINVETPTGEEPGTDPVVVVLPPNAEPGFVGADEEEPGVDTEPVGIPTDSGYCWYCAQLPQRSMIFDGNVMTTNGHFVRSTDLNTCEAAWKIDISLKNEGSSCCGAFYY